MHPQTVSDRLEAAADNAAWVADSLSLRRWSAHYLYRRCQSSVEISAYLPPLGDVTAARLCPFVTPFTPPWLAVLRDEVGAAGAGFVLGRSWAHLFPAR